MKRILVTGGAGFIGSNLSKTLLDTGKYFIYCLDNFDSSYLRIQKEQNIESLRARGDFKLIEGDIRNPGDLRKAKDIDIVIHLAAKTGVRPSIYEPAAYYDVNVRGTQNLLEFAREQHIRQFIFASSSSVYGINKNSPWKEDEPLLPISPYASTKLSGEMMGHVYSHLYGIRFIGLRFFTVYGPSQRPDLAIHKFVKSVMENKPIPMFGMGLSGRDYTYVDDVVKGIHAAIEYSSSDFELINLGNSKPVLLKTLLEIIQEITGKKALITNLPEQPGDVLMTNADISKARRLLRYDPTTLLEDGIRKFYNWYIGYVVRSQPLVMFG